MNIGIIIIFFFIRSNSINFLLKPFALRCWATLCWWWFSRSELFLHRSGRSSRLTSTSRPGIPSWSRFLRRSKQCRWRLCWARRWRNTLRSMRTGCCGFPDWPFRRTSDSKDEPTQRRWPCQPTWKRKPGGSWSELQRCVLRGLLEGALGKTAGAGRDWR